MADQVKTEEVLTKQFTVHASYINQDGEDAVFCRTFEAIEMGQVDWHVKNVVLKDCCKKLRNMRISVRGQGSRVGNAFLLPASAPSTVLGDAVPKVSYISMLPTPTVKQEDKKPPYLLKNCPWAKEYPVVPGIGTGTGKKLSDHPFYKASWSVPTYKLAEG